MVLYLRGGLVVVVGVVCSAVWSPIVAVASAVGGDGDGGMHGSAHNSVFCCSVVTVGGVVVGVRCSYW